MKDKGDPYRMMLLVGYLSLFGSLMVLNESRNETLRSCRPRVVPFVELN